MVRPFFVCDHARAIIYNFRAVLQTTWHSLQIKYIIIMKYHNDFFVFIFYNGNNEDYIKSDISPKHLGNMVQPTWMTADIWRIAADFRARASRCDHQTVLTTSLIGYTPHSMMGTGSCTQATVTGSRCSLKKIRYMYRCFTGGMSFCSCHVSAFLLKSGIISNRKGSLTKRNT